MYAEMLSYRSRSHTVSQKTRRGNASAIKSHLKLANRLLNQVNCVLARFRGRRAQYIFFNLRKNEEKVKITAGLFPQPFVRSLYYHLTFEHKTSCYNALNFLKVLKRMALNPQCTLKLSLLFATRGFKDNLQCGPLRQNGRTALLWCRIHVVQGQCE